MPGNASPAIAPPSSITNHGRTPRRVSSATASSADVPLTSSSQPKLSQTSCAGVKPVLQQALDGLARSRRRSPCRRGCRGPRRRRRGSRRRTAGAARGRRRRRAPRRGGPSARPGARRSRPPSGTAGRACRPGSARGRRTGAGRVARARRGACRRPRCRRGPVAVGDGGDADEGLELLDRRGPSRRLRLGPARHGPIGGYRPRPRALACWHAHALVALAAAALLATPVVRRRLATAVRRAAPSTEGQVVWTNRGRPTAASRSSSPTPTAPASATLTHAGQGRGAPRRAVLADGQVDRLRGRRRAHGPRYGWCVPTAATTTGSRWAVRRRASASGDRPGRGKEVPDVTKVKGPVGDGHPAESVIWSVRHRTARSRSARSFCAEPGKYQDSSRRCRAAASSSSGRGCGSPTASRRSCASTPTATTSLEPPVELGLSRPTTSASATSGPTRDLVDLRVQRPGRPERDVRRPRARCRSAATA